MHLDFVEEAYWKRVSALKFAMACKPIALEKAKKFKIERLK